MRLRAHIDENQTEVVEALRKAGASVQHLAAVGKGCPDLLVGYEGRTLLMEVKWPLKKSRLKLTPAQEKWHAAWKGQKAIVTSAGEALRLLGVQHG